MHHDSRTCRFVNLVPSGESSLRPSGRRLLELRSRRRRLLYHESPSHTQWQRNQLTVACAALAIWFKSNKPSSLSRISRKRPTASASLARWTMSGDRMLRTRALARRVIDCRPTDGPLIDECKKEADSRSESGTSILCSSGSFCAAEVQDSPLVRTTR